MNSERSSGEELFFQRAQERKKTIRTDGQDVFAERAEEREPKRPGVVETLVESQRGPTRRASRVVETVLGLPGDVKNFIGGFATFAAESIAGEELPRVRQLFAAAPEGTVGFGLPTSEELKKFSVESTKGFTAPRDEMERRGDEFVEDVTAFSLPGTGKFKLARNVGLPVLGQAAELGAKKLGAEETGQKAVKIGTMVITDLMTRGSAKKFAGELLSESENSIGAADKINFSPMESQLKQINKQLELGGSAPSKTKALAKIGELLKKGRSGEILVKELPEFRRNINEIIDEAGGFDITPNVSQSTIRNLNKVKKVVINGLDEYGRTQNPEFLRLNQAGNEAFAAWASSERLSQYMRKKIPYGVKSTGAALLFHGLLGPIEAVAAAGTFGIYQGYKVMDRISKSPALRKYYAQTIQAAAKQNAPAMIKNLSLLDDRLALEEKQEAERKKKPKNR